MTGPGAEGGHWPGWAGQDEAAGPRGSLRIYLGFAPGAGATCALLNEGGQWAERGADVVIACADTRGRPYTAGLLAGLPERPGRRGRARPRRPCRWIWAACWPERRR